MRYDRDEWHSGGDYPSDLPPENGGTHIGMFLAWAIINGLAGDHLRRYAKTELDALAARHVTGGEFLRRVCDGKFCDDELNDEGNAFARDYYGEGGDVGPYFQDYDDALCAGLPSIYHVADVWENYDRIAAVIDERYAAWQRRRGRSG